MTVRSNLRLRFFVIKLALIINPVASSVTARTRVVIQKALAADHELQIIETTRSNHATRLAHQLEREGVDVVIPFGGDGTVNEVANGLLRTSTAVAPLPGGSTNVFARAIGYPNDAVEATGMILESLAQRSIVSASLGSANGRAFVFHVGVGFDAAVVDRVERRGPLKRYAGHAWFVWSAIRTWGSAERRALRFSVNADDGRRIDHAQIAVALNVNPYTFLGTQPLDLAPEANLDSPLSVVALDSVGAAKLIPAAVTALRSSTGLPDENGMHHWTNVLGVTLSSDRPFPYQLDGEPQDPVTSLRLEHLPNALNVVVPTPAATY
ncbi:MAG: diacylglycerol/lipid kinase family protein [Acidimicrobiales bacterium]